MTEASPVMMEERRRNALRGAFSGVAAAVMATALFVAFLSVGWSGPTWEPSIVGASRRDSLKFLGFAEDAGPTAAHAIVAFLVLVAAAALGARIGRRLGDDAGPPGARRRRVMIGAAGWHLVLVLSVVLLVLLPEFRAARASDAPGLALTAVVAFAAGVLMLIPFAFLPFVACSFILEVWTRPSASGVQMHSGARSVMALLGILLLSAAITAGGVFRLFAAGG